MSDEPDHEDPPEDVIDEAERLTRRAREAVDEAEADAARREREALLAEYGFTARVREDGGEGDDGQRASEAASDRSPRGATLVVHPDDWLVDGTVQVERIDDVDRAVERPLEAPGEGDDWERVDEYNRALVERVADAHGEVHARNAAAFADFMSNHYAKPVGAATERMREEFLTDYFPRNAWPDDDQRAVVEESVELVVSMARESERL